MKKIILTIIVLLLVTSCYNENNGDKLGDSEKEISLKIVESGTGEKKYDISVSDLKENIDKLEGVNVEGKELGHLNDEIINLYNKGVEKKAYNEGNYEVCNTLLDGNKDSCILDYALRKGLEKEDEKECDIILNENNEASCKNAINLSLSIKKKDVSYCDKLISSKSINKSLNNEISECKSELNFTIALEKESKSYCEKITNKEVREECLFMLK